MHEWFNLTDYLGEDTSNPTDEQLKAALALLFEAKDNEHPNAWITCGSEKGKLYTLDIYSDGFALYTVYNNVDMEEELEYRRIENVTSAVAFDLWKNLINDKLSNS